MKCHSERAKHWEKVNIHSLSLLQLGPAMVWWCVSADSWTILMFLTSNIFYIIAQTELSLSNTFLKLILCSYRRMNFSPMADASVNPSLPPATAGWNSEAKRVPGTDPNSCLQIGFMTYAEQGTQAIKLETAFYVMFLIFTSIFLLRISRHTARFDLFSTFICELSSFC